MSLMSFASCLKKTPKISRMNFLSTRFVTHAPDISRQLVQIGRQVPGLFIAEMFFDLHDEKEENTREIKTNAQNTCVFYLMHLAPKCFDMQWLNETLCSRAFRPNNVARMFPFKQTIHRDHFLCASLRRWSLSCDAVSWCLSDNSLWVSLAMPRDTGLSSSYSSANLYFCKNGGR